MTATGASGIALPTIVIERTGRKPSVLIPALHHRAPLPPAAVSNSYSNGPGPLPPISRIVEWRSQHIRPTATDYTIESQVAAWIHAECPEPRRADAARLIFGPHWRMVDLNEIAPRGGIDPDEVLQDPARGLILRLVHRQMPDQLILRFAVLFMRRRLDGLMIDPDSIQALAATPLAFHAALAPLYARMTRKSDFEDTLDRLDLLERHVSRHQDEIRAIDPYFYGAYIAAVLAPSERPLLALTARLGAQRMVETLCAAGRHTTTAQQARIGHARRTILKAAQETSVEVPRLGDAADDLAIIGLVEALGFQPHLDHKTAGRAAGDASAMAGLLGLDPTLYPDLRPALLGALITSARAPTNAGDAPRLSALLEALTRAIADHGRNQTIAAIAATRRLITRLSDQLSSYLLPHTPERILATPVAEQILQSSNPDTVAQIIEAMGAHFYRDAFRRFLRHIRHLDRAIPPAYPIEPVPRLMPARHHPKDAQGLAILAARLQPDDLPGDPEACADALAAARRTIDRLIALCQDGRVDIHDDRMTPAGHAPSFLGTRTANPIALLLKDPSRTWTLLLHCKGGGVLFRIDRAQPGPLVALLQELQSILALPRVSPETLRAALRARSTGTTSTKTPQPPADADTLLSHTQILCQTGPRSFTYSGLSAADHYAAVGSRTARPISVPRTIDWTQV